MAPGKWGTSCSPSVGARWPHMALDQSTRANKRTTDDEEEDSTPPSSPPNKPIARRSKFDDEEEDSDVRQPTMPTVPRHAQLLPRHA
jgi:hypothetical protein